jgi:hypothetical protein
LKLREKLQELPEDTLIYIGAKCAFLLAGTKDELPEMCQWQDLQSKEQLAYLIGLKEKHYAVNALLPNSTMVLR